MKKSSSPKSAKKPIVAAKVTVATRGAFKANKKR